MNKMDEKKKIKITLYIKWYCPFCQRAMALLKKTGYPFKTIEVTQALEEFETMKKRFNVRTVPQIFFGSSHIGGCDDLLALQKNNLLYTHLLSLEQQGEEEAPPPVKHTRP